MTAIIMATDAEVLTSAQELLVEHLKRFARVEVILAIPSLDFASADVATLLARCNLDAMVAGIDPRIRSKVFALNRVQTLTIAEDLEPLQLAGSLDLITEAQLFPGDHVWSAAKWIVMAFYADAIEYTSSATLEAARKK